jgi:hypothetical protein
LVGVHPLSGSFDGKLHKWVHKLAKVMPSISTSNSGRQMSATT